MPSDVELAKLCDAEYEYRAHTNIAHGAPLVIRAMEAMYQDRSNPEAAGAAFMHFVFTCAHAHCLASWAYAGYMMEDANLANIRELLESIYEKLQFNEEARAFFR